jgi:shikimate O-hydroxycinnamoyltransferase
MDCKEKQTLRAHACSELPQRLTCLDIMTGHVNSGSVYFYRTTPDIPRLKQSLQQAIATSPVFASSLRRIGDEFLLYPNEGGISFSVFISDKAAPHADDRNAPLLDDSELVDGDVPYAGIFNGATPLHFLRLTIFSDGSCALGHRNVHSLADGSAIIRFFGRWSALYKGLTPASPSKWPRSEIERLAGAVATRHSPRLSVVARPDIDLPEIMTNNKKNFGSIRTELPIHLLERLVKRCRSLAEQTVSSSDIIHALVWKAFCKATDVDPRQLSRVFSVFDIRRTPDLGIPDDYDGNAILERKAEIGFGAARAMSIHQLAVLFNRQTKPLTAPDVRRDLAFLQGHLAGGMLTRSGNYSDIVRGSLIDCLAGTGIFVNDMRFIRAENLSFDQEPYRHEVLLSPCFCMAIIQQTGEHVRIRYIGPRRTLDAFAAQVAQIASGDGAQAAAAR